MSGDRTSCVRHAANTHFFILFADILTLSQHNYAEAAAHRVLETKTNDRLTYLRETGQGGVSDEDLWITLSWHDFTERSMGLYTERTFQDTLPRLEKAGYARARYVKLDEYGRLVTDERGRLLIYKTYKEAQRDREHSGTVAKQYLYCFRKVNAAITKLHPEPEEPEPPTPDEGEEREAPRVTPPAGEGQEDTSGIRGGNLQYTEASSTASDSSITHPLEKMPTGRKNGAKEDGNPLEELPIPPGNSSATPSQFFPDPLEILPRPVGKIASNKYYGVIESDEESNDRMTVATEGPVAVILSDDDEKSDERTDAPEEVWTVPAILNLAAQYLPALPTHLRAEQRQMNETQWLEAAQAIYEASSFHFIGPEGAILMLADMLDFMTNPQSPSWWAQVFTAIQHKEIRLWHVARNAQAISQDMLKFGWPRTVIVVEADQNQASRAEPDRDPEVTVTPELVPEPLEVSEPRGMNEAEADALLAEICMSHTQFYPRKVRVYGRVGYKIELSTSPGRQVVLYSVADWQALVESWKAAPKPSERFRSLLRQKAG